MNRRNERGYSRSTTYYNDHHTITTMIIYTIHTQAKKQRVMIHPSTFFSSKLTTFFILTCYMKMRGWLWLKVILYTTKPFTKYMYYKLVLKSKIFLFASLKGYAPTSSLLLLHIQIFIKNTGDIFIPFKKALYTPHTIMPKRLYLFYSACEWGFTSPAIQMQINI